MKGKWICYVTIRRQWCPTGDSLLDCPSEESFGRLRINSATKNLEILRYAQDDNVKLPVGHYLNLAAFCQLSAAYWIFALRKSSSFPVNPFGKPLSHQPLNGVPRLSEGLQTF